LISFGGYAGELTLLNDFYLLPLQFNQNQISTSYSSWKKLSLKNKPKIRYGHSLSFYFNNTAPFPHLLLFGGVTQDFVKLNSLSSLELSFFNPEDIEELSKPDKSISSNWSCMMCTFENPAGSNSCMVCGFMQ